MALRFNKYMVDKLEKKIADELIFAINRSRI